MKLDLNENGLSKNELILELTLARISPTAATWRAPSRRGTRSSSAPT